ncbi:MAG: S9 family peptidase, partial [Actinomycetota bacterium]
MSDSTIDDRFLWLEDVEGEDALGWVRARNAEAEAAWFDTPDFERIRASTLAILEADDRIDVPTRHGERVHNFWTDAEHRRGLLRRTSWDEWVGGDPEWETVLDVDALCDAEGESWVFGGSATRRPDRRRALVSLSPGGSDASVTREFDLVERRFVPAEDGGFVRPLAKGGLTWIDDDTVYVTSDFGPGSLTRSGYPRTVRRWRRGTPIEDAEIVFEGEESDVAVGVSVSHLPGHEHHVVERAPDFFTTRTALLRDGEVIDLDLPDDAQMAIFERWLFVLPRSEFFVEADAADPSDGAATGDDRAWPGGSLLVIELERFLSGERGFVSLFMPTATTALGDFACTRTRVVINVLDDVRTSLLVATPPTNDPTDASTTDGSTTDGSTTNRSTTRSEE